MFTHLKLKNFKYISLILILFLILIILANCAIKPNNFKIWITAQDYVKSKLDATITATFPDKYEDHISEIGENKYRVESYVVKKDNSCCGPIVRTFFSCVVEYQKGKYIAHSLKFYNSDKWEKPLF